MMKLISILLDLKNEEKNIKHLVERIEAVFYNFSNYKFELIIISDQSTDSTNKIIKEIKKEKNFPIKAYKTIYRLWRDRSKLVGFQKCDGEAIIYLDSDLQDPPELIPEILKKYEEGNEVVHTVRKSRAGEKKLKIFLTFIAYRLVRFFSGSKSPYDSGEYKLISKKVAKYFINFGEYEPNFKNLFGHLSFKFDIVKYDRDARFQGQTNFSLLSSTNPYREFLRATIMYSNRIIPIFFLLISLFFIVSVVYVLLNLTQISLFNFLILSFLNIFLFLLLTILFKVDAYRTNKKKKNPNEEIEEI